MTIPGDAFKYMPVSMNEIVILVQKKLEFCEMFSKELCSLNVIFLGTDTKPRLRQDPDISSNIKQNCKKISHQ